MEINGKPVLVTGACGFIGSHLTHRLIERGAKVRAFVQYNSTGSIGWLNDLPKTVQKEVEIISGDIRDFDRVNAALKGRDLVFHLAALIGIPYSYESPDAYVKTNIEGTLNVLQAARHLGTEKTLVTSTSEVYGSALYTPIDEKHPMQPQSPYSATKIAADSLTESFYRSFNLPVVIARPFNTFGPRQSARAVIPTVITQILSGVKSIQLGSLVPLRDFTFVKDTADGMIAVATAPESVGKSINIGRGESISIGDLVKKIQSLLGSNVTIECAEERVRPERSEVNHLLCNADLLKSMTDWAPKYSLEQGLVETIEWLKIHLHQYRTDQYQT